jgi:hypothetical protein
MRLSKINKIRKKYKVVFKILADYDKTHKLQIGRERIDITLNKKIIQKLREIKEKTGKPISQIIEEAITNKF